jgi:hypothetical protein
MKNNSSFFLLILILCSSISFGQIGLGTTSPATTAVLDLSSSSKGLLTPRMTILQRNAIVSPAIGLIIYNTDDADFNTYNGTTLGWQDFNARYKKITSNINTTTALLSDELVSEMTFSPSEGNYMVSFNGQYKNNPSTTVTTIVTQNASSIDTSLCHPAFLKMLHQLDSIPSDDPNFNPLLGNGLLPEGQIVYPGKYYIPAALSLSQNITLEANGDENALFIFIANGSIDARINTKIFLAGGAKACNVYWVAFGAIGIGTDCTIIGNLISKNAAIAMGFRSNIEGRMFSGVGAISFGPGTAKVPLETSAIDLGVLKEFLIYTHNGELGNMICGANTEGNYFGYILSDSGANLGFQTATLQYPIISSGTIITLPEGAPTSTTTYVYNQVENTALGAANFSIYSNGALVASSTKTVPSSSVIANVSLRRIVSVSNGQSVQIRWNTTAETLLMKNRTLTLVRVQ